jgi:FkbM family methyltransferase
MASPRNLALPAYLFQPWQILRRLTRELSSPGSAEQCVRLPWGLQINVNPREAIGRAIWTQGLYDPALTELIWRLTARGDTTLDVGANIGYVASIMAVRAGRAGAVHCFEPHPSLAARLRENVQSWRKISALAPVIVRQVAAGSRTGNAQLEIPEDFLGNQGTARLSDEKSDSGAQRIHVEIARLDDVLRDLPEIGIMKVDVEGHELEVLEGLGSLLTQRLVRDIIFEEFRSYPAETHKLLQRSGYSVFNTEEHLDHPVLVPVGRPYKLNPMQPPNCLATREPERALRLMRRRIWRSFGFGRYFRI